MKKSLITLVGYLALTACAVPAPRPEDVVPPTATNTLVLTALSVPARQRLYVRVDAVDQYGNRGHNAETGLSYPWEGFRTDPYKHTIYYEPGIQVTVTFTVYAASDRTRNVGCIVTDKGVEIRAEERHATVNGDTTKSAICRYTTPG